MAAMTRRDGTPRPPKPAARPKRQKREARPEKIAAFGLGISAESRAAVWLLAHGYRILARRWKSPLGEIDIIAARRHLLIFVEVKARAKLDDAAEAVTERQSNGSRRRRKSGLPLTPCLPFATCASMRSWSRPDGCRATSRRRSRRIEIRR